MRRELEKYRGLIAGLLLLVISACYVNSTLFLHSHTINGIRIVHSHIYNGSHTSAPDGDGGHTLEIVKLIATINDNIQFENQSFDNNIEVKISIIETVYKVLSTVVSKFEIDHRCYLKAPPIC